MAAYQLLAECSIWRAISRDRHPDIDETRHHDDTRSMTTPKKGGGITGTGGVSEATTRPCTLDRVDIELVLAPIPPTRLPIRATPTSPHLHTLSPRRCATAAWCSSPTSCVARSRWAPPPPLPPRWRGRREAGAGQEKEEISGRSLPQRADTSTVHSSHGSPSLLPHTTPALTSSSSSTFPPEFFALAQYSHTSEATPHPRAESSSSPPFICRALVVPSASQNVVERVVLRVASDAEPQRCYTARSYDGDGCGSMRLGR
ncbi:hypothetical protein C8R45DRAFT_1109890 [Mycena sanguinolenta]|nr:hypothetical protein C8R45DRAFT_1109890 [Mycena sanguinolenta]